MIIIIQIIFYPMVKNFFIVNRVTKSLLQKIIPIGNILLSKKIRKTNLSDKKIKRSKLNILYISDGNSDNFLSYAKRKYPDLVLYKIQKKFYLIYTKMIIITSHIDLSLQEMKIILARLR